MLPRVAVLAARAATRTVELHRLHAPRSFSPPSSLSLTCSPSLSSVRCASTNAAALSAFNVPSARKPLRVAIVGASGGLGTALVTRLANSPEVAEVFAVSRSPATRLRDSLSGEAATKVTYIDGIDFTVDADVARAAAAAKEGGQLDMVLATPGMLHREADEEKKSIRISPEKAWRELDPDMFLEVVRVNTVGPALIGKHFLPLLPKRERAIFAAISARVGSIGDNQMGGWYSYRASKAALNMVLRNFAIELGRKNKEAVVAALHPGTVETHLSSPFQRGVPAGKLFTPDYSAGCLFEVLDGLKSEDSGRLFAWDGECIEY